MSDPVNHPDHYNQGEIECIQAIRAALGVTGFIDYCRGQVIKYTWRCRYKGNQEQDMRKAEWYANEAAKASNGFTKQEEQWFEEVVVEAPEPDRRAFCPAVFQSERPETD